MTDFSSKLPKYSSQKDRVVSDEGTRLVGTGDAIVCCAITTMDYRGVLIHVWEPNGFIEGEVLKWLEVTLGNAP